MRIGIYIIAFFFVVLLFVGGNCNPSTVPADPPKNKQLVSQAKLYLRTAWRWFIPDSTRVFGGGNGTQFNDNAVCWANNGLLNLYGGHETISSFNTHMYYALKDNQTKWSQYFPTFSDSAGWPGGEFPEYYNNAHKAGFICYALVADALQDAGYGIDADTIYSCDWFLRYPIVTGSAQEGDIVLYDFDRDSSYDHVGIIVDVSGGNQDNYMVISSIGIVEHFKYGAAKKRLGIFGSATSGGDFTTWNPLWEPINKLIVRSN
ncbi:MAG: CHAP domain-containing protein [Ignavibacteriales bacterium]|nr:CHAP domain-containing protein [Ignavibacteriales bacterium]